MATPGDLVKQNQSNASAAAAADATMLSNLQAFVGTNVGQLQARINQINTVDIPAQNTVIADCNAANPPDTQAATDAQNAIAALNAEITGRQATIAALNALLPTS